MMDIAGSQTASLLAMFLVVASILFSTMVMTGLLVPRWAYRQVVTERDRWRDDAQDCSRTVIASQLHQQMLLETVTRLQEEQEHRDDDPSSTGG